jgi:hypothetical protein
MVVTLRPQRYALSFYHDGGVPSAS